MLDFSMHYLMVVAILAQYIKRLRSKIAHLEHYGPFLNIKDKTKVRR